MIVSLNEIESLALKACRGAGMSWGMAEEAAQAARWLAICGLPWEKSLADLLSHRSALSPPQLVGNELRLARPTGELCAIHAGAAVSDLLAAKRSLVLHHVREPLWLLPFAMRHAKGSMAIVLRWPGGKINSATRPRPDSCPLSISHVPMISIELLPGAELADAGISLGSGVLVDDEIWSQLNSFAALTYVPATDQSRLAGAGAGLIDND